MAVETLLWINTAFFVLYAGVVFVSSKVLGGWRAVLWFSGANLAWALAMLFRLSPAHLSPGLSQAGSTILMVGGVVLLHRSFAELLDRRKLLWRLQCVLLLLTLIGLTYFAHTRVQYPASLLLGAAVLGTQTALVASALFSFSGEGVESAGWFTGIVLCLYALIHLMRVAVTLRYGSDVYPRAARDMEQVWLCGTLLASSATTFGFLIIGMGKLRLELLWRAQIDELTGLLNRWAFKRIAVRETFRSMRMRGRLSVVMMDLDGMKRVNDQLGHGAGDIVLQAVSASLQEALRDRDSIARMGGDEFCILLPDTEMEEAMTVAERLRSQLEALAIRYRGETIHVKASFGVCSSEQCGWNWQNLLDESDAALYEAKRSGPNKVIAASPPKAPMVPVPEILMQPVISERRRR